MPASPISSAQDRLTARSVVDERDLSPWIRLLCEFVYIFTANFFIEKTKPSDTTKDTML